MVTSVLLPSTDKLLLQGVSHLKTAELHRDSLVTLGHRCDGSSSQIWGAPSRLR